LKILFRRKESQNTIPNIITENKPLLNDEQQGEDTEKMIDNNQEESKDPTKINLNQEQLYNSDKQDDLRIDLQHSEQKEDEILLSPNPQYPLEVKTNNSIADNKIMEKMGEEDVSWTVIKEIPFTGWLMLFIMSTSSTVYL